MMNRMSYKSAVLVTALLACTVSGAAGPDGSPEVIRPLNLRQMALFQNGLAFFVGEAALPAGTTSGRFALPAAPSEGTFWLSFPPQVNLTSIVAKKTETEGKLREATTIPEILKANVGREVELTVSKKKLIRGRIIGLAASPSPIRPLPASAGSTGRGEIVPPYEPGLVLLDVNGGTFCLDPRTVEHVLFPAGRIERRFAETAETVEVRVQTAAPADDLTITVSFLARGITWTPSYLVDLSGPDRASLSAKALIINETYDLNGVTTQLVTGFPHVKYAAILSPIGLEQSLSEFLQALGMTTTGPAVRRLAYAMTPQAEAALGAAPGVPPSYGPAEEGVTAGSLFLYPAGRITLAKDRVAYVPLFTVAVPYEQLYRWTIPATTDETGYLRPVAPPPSDKEEPQEIWHILRLHNTTQVPWAKAPAEAIQNATLLGQDTLEATPPGDEATLQITRALDVKGERQELEVSRTRGAVQVNKVPYDLVTVRGELSVTNYRNEPITLEIVKTVVGEVQSTEPPAKTETLATGLKQMNPRTKLTWTLRLDAAEKRVVTYTYQVYVRP